MERKNPHELWTELNICQTFSFMNKLMLLKALSLHISIYSQIFRLEHHPEQIHFRIPAEHFSNQKSELVWVLFFFKLKVKILIPSLPFIL